MLKKQTDVAHQKGIFGAPTFYVGEEIFWGNDRLEKAIQWALTEQVQ
jgi:2-hydroxychromene-2-carboxylate isomerase